MIEFLKEQEGSKVFNAFITSWFVLLIFIAMFVLAAMIGKG